MISSVARYERAVKQMLPCGAKARKAQMCRFREVVKSFLEEHPDPTEQELYSAFGPPEAMAEVLSEGIPAGEQARYQNLRVLKRIAAAALVVMILVFAIYVYFFKEIPIIVVDMDIPHKVGSYQFPYTP